jgi:hypothetical protein
MMFFNSDHYLAAEGDPAYPVIFKLSALPRVALFRLVVVLPLAVFGPFGSLYSQNIA